MDQSQLIDIVADIVEVDPATITMDAELDEIGWDSLAVISFIAEVNEATGKTVAPAALRECKTVSDLAELV